MRERRRFSPSLRSCVITLIGCSILFGLGVWQIRRGQQKVAYLAQRTSALAKPARGLNALADSALPAAPHSLRVWAEGHYDAGRQLLLEGQSHGAQNGYDVLTPFVLDGGKMVLVNRGWIPASDANGAALVQVLAVAEDPLRRIHGLWRNLPRPGLRLDAHNCRAQPWPRRVSYPTDADLRCLYGATMRRGEVELDPAAADGFARDWNTGIGFPAIRHYGYAAQWFMFCLIGLYLFYRLNLHGVSTETERMARTPTQAGTRHE